MDQPAARQCAHRCRSRDGALRARGSGARLRRLARPRGDHRPEQGQRRHHRVMVSLRVGARALPLAWRVKKTQGAIGFREQRAALATVAALLPAGVRPTLMGDRFYGSPALIAWCRDHGWGWRLRCKQDLLVFDHNGGATTLAACFARGEHRLEDVALTGKRARTHVAMVHAEGQAEPWIIAMSDRPTPGRA